jgi:hypothetical protein
MKTKNINLELPDIHAIKNTKTKDILRSKCLKINIFMTEYSIKKMEKLFYMTLFKPQEDRVDPQSYFYKIKSNKLLEFTQGSKITSI